MKKEFVPYELAVKLKTLGFDEPCVAIFGRNNELSVHDGFYKQENYHKDTILTPTYSQAFRWFREKYQLNGLLNHYPNTKEWDCSVHNLNWSGKELMEYMKTEDRSVKYSTYEEAELACLDKLLEIVEFKSE